MQEVREWFVGIGLEKEEIMKNLWEENLDRIKDKILKKLYKKREKRLKERNRERKKKQNG